MNEITDNDINKLDDELSLLAERQDNEDALGLIGAVRKARVCKPRTRSLVKSKVKG